MKIAVLGFGVEKVGLGFDEGDLAANEGEGVAVVVGDGVAGGEEGPAFAHGGEGMALGVEAGDAEGSEVAFDEKAPDASVLLEGADGAPVGVEKGIGVGEDGDFFLHDQGALLKEIGVFHVCERFDFFGLQKY